MSNQFQAEYTPTAARQKLYQLILDANQSPKPIFIHGQSIDKQAVLISKLQYEQLQQFQKQHTNVDKTFETQIMDLVQLVDEDVNQVSLTKLTNVFTPLINTDNQYFALCQAYIGALTFMSIYNAQKMLTVNDLIGGLQQHRTFDAFHAWVIQSANHPDAIFNSQLIMATFETFNTLATSDYTKDMLIKTLLLRLMSLKMD